MSMVLLSLASLERGSKSQTYVFAPFPSLCGTQGRVSYESVSIRLEAWVKPRNVGKHCFLLLSARRHWARTSW